MVLMQRYISNPFLINGRKFDFRVYPLVISANPLIAVFLFGSVRISLTEYDLENESMQAHLTNINASKGQPNFK